MCSLYTARVIEQMMCCWRNWSCLLQCSKTSVYGRFSTSSIQQLGNKSFFRADMPEPNPTKATSLDTRIRSDIFPLLLFTLGLQDQLPQIFSDPDCSVRVCVELPPYQYFPTFSSCFGLHRAVPSPFHTSVRSTPDFRGSNRSPTSSFQDCDSRL